MEGNKLPVLVLIRTQASWEAIILPTTDSHWGDRRARGRAEQVAVQCLEDHARLPGQARGLGIPDINYIKLQKIRGGQQMVGAETKV